MSAPELSIVTPSYNQAEYIEDNLQSVLEEADERVEHVVVDGGSDDGTVDLLREYEDKYQLRWVSEPDDGQSAALNKGVEMARGEWIGWQNSDDYYVDGAFAEFWDVRESHPRADVIYGDLIIIDAEGREINRAYHIDPSKFVQRYANIMANQAAFFRKSTIQSLGGIREDYHYCMDIDLFWRLTHSDARMVHVPECIGYFRVVEEAKTGGEKTNQHLEERREIQQSYSVPIYEKLVPNDVLRVLALGLKATYLLRDRRVEALRQPLAKVGVGSGPV